MSGEEYLSPKNSAEALWLQLTLHGPKQYTDELIDKYQNAQVFEQTFMLAHFICDVTYDTEEEIPPEVHNYMRGVVLGLEVALGLFPREGADSSMTQYVNNLVKKAEKASNNQDDPSGSSFRKSLEDYSDIGLRSNPDLRKLIMDQCQIITVDAESQRYIRRAFGLIYRIASDKGLRGDMGEQGAERILQDGLLLTTDIGTDIEIDWDGELLKLIESDPQSE